MRLRWSHRLSAQRGQGLLRHSAPARSSGIFWRLPMPCGRFVCSARQRRSVRTVTRSLMLAASIPEHSDTLWRKFLRRRGNPPRLQAFCRGRRGRRERLISRRISRNYCGTLPGRPKSVFARACGTCFQRPQTERTEGGNRREEMYCLRCAAFRGAVAYH